MTPQIIDPEYTFYVRNFEQHYKAQVYHHDKPALNEIHEDVLVYFLKGVAAAIAAKELTNIYC